MGHCAFNLSLGQAARRSGLTLIELLIVIAVIGILVASVLVASTSLIGKSKARNTKSVLQIVADAVEQFKREQTERPTLTQNPAYRKRYGQYPPDELEAFSPQGVPGTSIRLLVPGDTSTLQIVPSPPYTEDMRFYTDGSVDDAKEHRDLAALVLAIKLHSDVAQSMLDNIPDRNRTAGSLLDGKPNQYVDRDGDDEFKSVDEQISYIVDDWGVPISYMAQRDHPGHGQPGAVPSNNMRTNGNWNEASTEFVRMNRGQPLIFSYGPDGKEQLKFDIMGDKGAASLVGDFVPATETPENKEHIIDHPANADNVYLSDELREKLAKGIEE